MPSPSSAWAILLPVILAVFIALLGVGIVIPVLPILATTLGASKFMLAMIIAVFSLSRGFLQPIVGNLSDQWGRKGFLLTGLGIYGLVGLLIAHATAVSQLMGIRLLQGAGAAMVVPVAMAYASYLAPPGQEGRYMGIVNGALFCGIGFGPMVGGLFADRWGIATVFYIMAGLSICALLFVLFTLPGYKTGESHIHRKLFESIRGMIARKRTMGILLARSATMLMLIPTMAFLPVIMADWPGSTHLHVGMVIAGRTMMNAVWQYPLGKLADRVNKLYLLFAGALVMCMAATLIPFMHAFLPMLGIYLILGIGEAMVWPALGAFAVEEGRAYFGHGTMMGVFNLAMSAGIFTGAVVTGTVMDWLGMRVAFPMTAAIMLFLSLVGMAWIRSGRSPALPPA